jgi:hypothetical protein
LNKTVAVQEKTGIKFLIVEPFPEKNKPKKKIFL